jgi:Fe-S-cluster containining protein
MACYRRAIMTTNIAPLRSAITLEETPDNEAFPVVLVDPELGQRIRLDARGVAVAELLDQPRTVEELTEALGVDDGVVEGAVQLFDRMHLLDTETSRAFVAEASAGQAWQQANPETVPLLIRDDATFTCTMCGSCCGGHNVGPVAVDIVQGLSDVREALVETTGTEKGLFFKVPVGAGGSREEQVVCHSSGGSCVFLGEDRLCSIHAAYGPEKKPRVCRLFPYQFIATPKGIAVSLQMECRGFNEARAGKPVIEQEAELRSLLALVPSLRRVRPVIMLDGLTPISYEVYEGLEDAMHAAIDDHTDDPLSALLAIRALTETARGVDPAAPCEDTDIASLQGDLDELVDALLQTVGALHRHYQRDDEQSVVHTETLDELAVAAMGLRPDWRRVSRPLDRADQRSLFREVMHHHLMGKELTNSRTLVLGVARTAFGWLVGKALMVARARQVKRRHLVTQDVMDAVVVTNFLLRNVGFLSAFQRHDQAVVSLFYDRLPALLAAGGELAGPDHRVEFYKF